jgi:hypothetical protein
MVKDAQSAANRMSAQTRARSDMPRLVHAGEEAAKIDIG